MPAARLGIASAFLPILAILYLLGFANLFLRSSFGVMAPDLAREMSLAPAALSGVASSFYITYALMQVPTGMLLDRFGPRLTLASMLLFTAVGTALFAVSPSAAGLSAGRLLMGFGCAGAMTGAFYVLAMWLPADRVVSQIGTLNSFAAFGILCSTTPLALLNGAIGWRTSFWIFTGIVLGLLIASALMMRDAPPGAEKPISRDEGLLDVVRGVHEVIRQPGMKRLLVAGLPLSAASTLAGVWGAPYLRDVHGLDHIGRGNLLLGMAVCGMVGHTLFGQLARRFNTMKWPIAGASSMLVVVTGLLALLPHPPVWVVAVLFCGIGLFGAYPTVAFAHARGLVPGHLTGRGVSVSNMGIMTAIATMQLVFGWIVGVFPATDGAYPEAAYRCAFAAQAGVALAALLIFLPVRDVQPRGAGKP